MIDLVKVAEEVLELLRADFLDAADERLEFILIPELKKRALADEAHDSESSG